LVGSFKVATALALPTWMRNDPLTPKQIHHRHTFHFFHGGYKKHMASVDRTEKQSTGNFCHRARQTRCLLCRQLVQVKAIRTRFRRGSEAAAESTSAIATGVVFTIFRQSANDTKPM